MKRVATLLLFTALLACSNPRSGEPNRPEHPTQADSVRYLALGDSYTIGEGVDESERFPVQLANLMRTRGALVDSPVIIAKTGWTTDELARAIEAARPERPVQLITLLIGVNNQYRGREVENYRQDLGQLLETAIDLAGGEASRVIVVSIPDWGVMPFAEGRDRSAIAREIDAFNAAARDEAEAAAARWVDITGLSRDLSRHEAMIADDALHPSGMMYSEWARRILPAALDAVKTVDDQ